MVEICKNKVMLTLNKPGYVGMWILDLIKVLMYEFYYDYIIIKKCQQVKNIIHRRWYIDVWN